MPVAPAPSAAVRAFGRCEQTFAPATAVAVAVAVAAAGASVVTTAVAAAAATAAVAAALFFAASVGVCSRLSRSGTHSSSSARDATPSVHGWNARWPSAPTSASVGVLTSQCFLTCCSVFCSSAFFSSSVIVCSPFCTGGVAVCRDGGGVDVVVPAVPPRSSLAVAVAY